MTDLPQQRPSRCTASLVSTTTLLALLAAGPARCERLELRDGSWIEIHGAPRTERGRVVFRTVEGNLRSLPLSELAPRVPADEPTSERIREYPSGAPLVFDEPPAPAPPPLPRRLDAPRLPRGCILGNARPGDPPAWVCDARDPPGSRTPERAADQEPG